MRRGSAAVASSLLSARFDIRALAQGLPQIVKNPEDLAAAPIVCMALGYVVLS